LLVTLLGLITLTVFLISLLAVINILTAGRNAERVGNVTLRVQAQEHLVNLTEVTAEKHDLRFQRVRADAEYISRYAESIFNHADRFNPSAYWQAEENMIHGQNGTYVSKSEDVAGSVVVPGGTDEPDDVLEKIALLDVLFAPIFQSHSDALLVSIVTKSGVVRSYPNLDMPGFVPPPLKTFLSQPYFDKATPENNPDRRVILTSEYEELIGLGLVSTASSPVYTGQGTFVGVVVLDISLTALMDEIEATSPLEDGYAFLINESGRIIALPEAGYADILGRSRRPDELGPHASEIIPAFAPVATAMGNLETGYQHVVINGRELSVAYASMPTTGWSLAHVAETEKLLQAVSELGNELNRSTRSLVLTRILPLAAVILVSVLGLGLWLTGRLIAPLQDLAVAARQIGEGRWDDALSPTGDTGRTAERDDEVGQLARSFQGMSDQLKTSFSELQSSNSELRLAQDELAVANEELEDRIAARTQEMAALFDVTMLTSESQYVSDLLGPALTRIIELGSCQAACIHLFSEDRGSLDMVAHRGLPAPMVPGIETIPLGEMLSEHVGLSGDPILIPELNGSEVLPAEMEVDGLRSYLGAQLRARGTALGLLSCFRVSGQQFLVSEVSLLAALAEQLGVVVENHRLYLQTRQMAVLEERQRMARDMHDSVTQSLYGLTLFARSARDAAEDRDDIRLDTSLGQLEDNSRKALAEMRLSLYQLQPVAVDRQGLADALQSRLDSVERRLGVIAELHLDGEMNLEPSEAEQLYHIAIEALNNALKHAGATKVDVRISSNGEDVKLEVSDNGCGFEVSRAQSGMGLNNMRTRAAILHARLIISSEPQAGTLIQAVTGSGQEVVANE
jgi:nitrate/nitrite-specific signal transduction histidine kinase